MTHLSHLDSLEEDGRWRSGGKYQKAESGKEPSVRLKIPANSLESR
jgi:hypothetical protein